MGDDVKVRLSADGVQEIIDALNKVRDAATSAGKANGEAMEHTATMTTRAKNELIVLAHEMTQGNFKKIPGSFMVLAESMGSVGHAMLGIIGPAAAAAAAIYLVAKAGIEAEATSRQMNIAIQETGNFAGETEGRMKELAAAISGSSRLTVGQANELVTTMVASGKIASNVIERVAAMTAQYAAKTHQDIEKLTPELVKMFADPTKGAEELRDRTHDLSAEQVEEIRRLQESGDLMGAQQKLADALGEHLGALTIKVGGFAHAWDSVKKAASGAWEALGKAVTGDFTKQEQVANINLQLASGGRQTPHAFIPLADTEKAALIKERDDLQKQIEDEKKKTEVAASKAEQNHVDSVAQGIIHSASYLARIDKLRNEIVALQKTSFTDPQLEAERKDAIHSINEQIETLQKSSVRNERQDAGNAYQLRVAKSQLEQQGLENDLKVLEQGLREQEEANAASYKRGEVSLDDYYARRRQIAERGTQQEIDILRKKAAAADIAGNAFNPATAVQRQTAELKLQGEIQQKQAELKRQLTGIEAQKQQELVDKKQKELELDARLATIAGDKTRAAKDRLEIAQNQLRLQLQQEGASPAQIDSALATSRSQGGAKIGFDATLHDANAAFADLQTKIKAIGDQVKSGQLFPIEGEQKIVDLERARLPVLADLVMRLQQAAAATKDPQLIAQAEAFSEKIQGVKNATDEAGQAMVLLKQTAESAFDSGLSNFFMAVGTGTDHIGGAFQKMAYSFVTSLAKMESEWAAKQFVKWLNGDGATGGLSNMLAKAGNFISGLFGGGAGGAAGGTAGAASSAAKTAAETANTTALVASTAVETSVGVSMTLLVAALAANTAAVTAAAAASGASGGGGGFASLFAATGGQIRGAGTGTSDSIPAMLSDGEFVVNAKAAGKPGVLALLHAINGTPGMASRGVAGVQRYADGGAVAGGAGASLKIINVPDASLLADHLDSAVGEQQVLNIISRNPSRVRQSLS